MEELADIIYETLSNNTDKFEENSFMALTSDGEILIEYKNKIYKIKIIKEE